MPSAACVPATPSTVGSIACQEAATDLAGDRPTRPAAAQSTRSRISRENLCVVLLVIAPPFQKLGLLKNTERFRVLWQPVSL